MDIYLLCLIVGGGLFALSLFGGHDSLLGGHALGDHAAPDSHATDVASWFSLRALVSFVAFFGLSGVLGGVAGVGGAGRLVMALAGGLIVGTLTSLAFRLARARGEVSGEAGNLTGRTGTVVVPPAPGRVGRVELVLAGQLQQLPASSADRLRPGDPVIVLGLTRGVLDVRAWDGA